MNKKKARLRRAKRARIQMRGLNKVRLCVNKTSRNIYAQILSADSSQVLVAASTTEASIKENIGHGGNVLAAKVVGRKIAERSVDKGITSIAFDRSGFKYHGCIKALADTARQHGLNF
jgi:large subunit ribosomal protein L18